MIFKYKVNDSASLHRLIIFLQIINKMFIEIYLWNIFLMTIYPAFPRILPMILRCHHSLITQLSLVSVKVQGFFISEQTRICTINFTYCKSVWYVMNMIMILMNLPNLLPFLLASLWTLTKVCCFSSQYWKFRYSKLAIKALWVFFIV